jgi:signal transduction histidine kinase/CheY-like chemotaxis protein
MAVESVSSPRSGSNGKHVNLYPARPLSLLILEDCEEDAELMVEELKRGGFDPAWKRVDTQADYLSELSANPPEVILADRNMPRFDAPRALDLLHKRGVDVPFIIVTGSISEEVTVDRMQQGATDYILKNKIECSGSGRRWSGRCAKKLREEKRLADLEIRCNLERIRVLHEIRPCDQLDPGSRRRAERLIGKDRVFFSYPCGIVVRLVDGTKQTAEPVAARGLDLAAWGRRVISGLAGRTKRVIESKQPTVIRDVQTDGASQDPDFYRRYGLVSAIILPLLVEDEVIGILNLDTHERCDFSREEVEFLNTLAGQAAIAIHNAQLYEEMSKLAAELAKSNKVKDEFLSVMSHELRTPLNVVVVYTGMIQDGVLGEINAEQERACAKVVRRANDLLDLVNTILYATSIEVRALAVHRQPCRLGDLFRELVSAGEAAIEKDLKLVWDLPDDLPEVITDGPKLRQAVWNLIHNAIKFMEQGKVVVSRRIVGDGDALPQPDIAEWLEVQVADTGPGIPPEHLGFIFDRFRQGDGTETRRHGGVGMGLYIAKKFTEMIGGTVEVQSELGNGSVFTVKLPILRASRQS